MLFNFVASGLRKPSRKKHENIAGQLTKNVFQFSFYNFALII